MLYTNNILDFYFRFLQQLFFFLFVREYEDRCYFFCSFPSAYLSIGCQIICSSSRSAWLLVDLFNGGTTGGTTSSGSWGSTTSTCTSGSWENTGHSIWHTTTSALVHFHDDGVAAPSACVRTLPCRQVNWLASSHVIISLHLSSMTCLSQELIFFLANIVSFCCAMSSLLKRPLSLVMIILVSLPVDL